MARAFDEAVANASAQGIQGEELVRIGKEAAERIAEALKYFSTPPDGLEHIFQGVVKGTKGWHHEPSSTIGTIVSIIKGPDTNGIYEATVKIGGVLKKDTSTFFPRKWSKTEVIEAIFDAYKNAKPVAKLDGTEFVQKWVGTSRGITIEMFLDKEGRIVSAFPKM